MTIYLRNFMPPYARTDSAKTVIDSVSLTGLFNFNNSPAGTYYLDVKYFNTIEVWSKSGGEALSSGGSVYNYDFTNSNTQAYGNNLKLKDDRYCMYSGDVNQDGIIDLTDFGLIDNNAFNFITGLRIPSDLNGDNVVDITDLQIADNNSNFIGVITP